MCRGRTGVGGGFCCATELVWGGGAGEQGTKETRSLFAKRTVKTEQLDTVIGLSSFQLTPISLKWDDKMAANGQTTTPACAHFSRNNPAVEPNRSTVQRNSHVLLHAHTNTQLIPGISLYWNQLTAHKVAPATGNCVRFWVKP